MLTCHAVFFYGTELKVCLQTYICSAPPDQRLSPVSVAKVTWSKSNSSLDGMLMYCSGVPPAGIQLYTWVKRNTVNVKCLAQEHNTLTPARLHQTSVNHSMQSWLWSIRLQSVMCIAKYTTGDLIFHYAHNLVNLG